MKCSKYCVFGYVIIRDGLKESNVVTKTFTVNDSGLPSDDDNGFSSDCGDTVRLENDYQPTRSKLGPRPSLGSAKAKVSAVDYFCFAASYLLITITVVISIKIEFMHVQ